MKELPKIPLGTWSWGTDASGGDQVFGNHLTAENLKPVFDAPMKEGLNLWDTATVYGMRASESILGGFAREYPRGEVIVSTKFTPQIVIAWAIAKPTLPIIGVTKPSHVEEAAQIALSPAEIETLESLAAATGADTRGSWENPMM